MFEKILQKMKSQRGENSSVTDRSLEDLAKTLQTLITTEEQLNTADFTTAIKSIESNISNVAATAVKKVKEKPAKTAQELKAEEDAAANANAAKLSADTTGEVIPAWATAFMNKVDAIDKSILGLKGDKILTSRTERLKKSLENLPEYYTKPIHTGFAKARFESDEEFDAYILEVETNRKSFEQAAKEQGLNTTVPLSSTTRKEVEGATPELQNAREVLQKSKDKQQKTV